MRASFLVATASAWGPLASWSATTRTGVELVTDTHVDVRGIRLKIGPYDADCGVLPSNPREENLQQARDHIYLSRIAWASEICFSWVWAPQEELELCPSRAVYEGSGQIPLATFESAEVMADGRGKAVVLLLTQSSKRTRDNGPWLFTGRVTPLLILVSSRRTLPRQDFESMPWVQAFAIGMPRKTSRHPSRHPLCPNWLHWRVGAPT